MNKYFKIKKLNQSIVLSIFGKVLCFGYIVARKKTCFWVNSHHNKYRSDNLFGVNRLYLREYRYYVYQLILFKFKLFMVMR